MANMQRARYLRQTETWAEKLMWRWLRDRRFCAYKFRRQHPFLDYVLDFACLEKALVVEVDGCQHQGSESDKVRDQRLISAGFRILCFWNNDVLLQTDAVAEVIRGALLTPRVETLPVGWPHSWRDGEVLRLRSDSSMPAFCIAT